MLPFIQRDQVAPPKPPCLSYPTTPVLPSSFSHFDGGSEVISISSSGTNETEDNLLGPGRNLGNAYGFLGRKLEAFAVRIAASRSLEPENDGRREETAMMVPYSGISRPDVEIISIISSNVTADNIPGPGRNLGNVYSSFGRKLETFINAISQSRGSGPKNVRRRIQNIVFGEDYLPNDNNLRPNERIKLRKELKRLIACTK